MTMPTQMRSPTDRVRVLPSAEVGGGMLTCVFAVQDASSPVPGGHSGYEGGSALYQLALPESGSGLRALAQDVPVAAFSEEALRERLADPATLEVVARMHHALVTAAAVDGPVVPLPLATLFTDRDRAVATLAARAGQFRALLDRLCGKVEWAVKVYLAQGDSAPPDAGRDAGPDAGAGPDVEGGGAQVPGSGRAYLDRVRARRRSREDRQAAALAEAERVDRRLRSLASDAVHRRPHGPQAAGRDRTQILNGAYLVDEGRAEQLNAVVSGLRAETALIEVEMSGPWVPYSFARLDAES